MLDGQYRYEGEPFTPEAFFGEAWEEYRGLFGSEDVTLCVVALPGYTDPHAPALGSISDGTDSFDGEPDMDRRAPLGVLVQGQDGSGYLLLRSVANTISGPLGLVESFNHVILPVGEATFSAARSADRVPVITQ